MARPATLGSWECLGEHYTCVFPPTDEPDPAVVRAIRQICPNYVPMLAIADWQSPSGGVHRLKYHVIATWQPYETEADRRKHVPTVKNCERPRGFPFSGGVLYAQRVWALSWPEGSPEYAENRPALTGIYDWDIYRFIKQIYEELGIPPGTRLMGDFADPGKQANENRKKQKAAEAAEVEKVEEDARLALRDDRHELKAVIDAGRWFPEPQEPQTYVELRAPEPPAPTPESGAPA